MYSNVFQYVKKTNMTHNVTKRQKCLYTTEICLVIWPPNEERAVDGDVQTMLILSISILYKIAIQHDNESIPVA